MKESPDKLKRPKHPMPAFIEEALNNRGLMEKYLERPAYQRNDYIGWIVKAKLQETRQRRLDQMLEELETGGLYMKMEHPPSKNV